MLMLYFYQTQMFLIFTYTIFMKHFNKKPENIAEILNTTSIVK